MSYDGGDVCLFIRQRNSRALLLINIHNMKASALGFRENL